MEALETLSPTTVPPTSGSMSSMARPRLTLPETDILAAYTAGESIQSIANRLGCDRGPVTRIVKDAGVYENRSGEYSRRQAEKRTSWRRQLAAQLRTEAVHATQADSKVRWVQLSPEIAVQIADELERRVRVQAGEEGQG